MSSTSETGHAKNVANFQKLIEQVKVYSKYNPSVDALKTVNLQTRYDAAKAKLTEVELIRRENKNAIAARQNTFKNLKSTATSAINHLDLLSLPENIMNQARSINREIQGASKKTEPVPEGEEPKDISTSRQSFTQMTENFGILIQLIETVPAYAPNEDEIKIPNLKTYHAALDSATKFVDQTEGLLNQKFKERDEMLYGEETGIVAISQSVKKYVKSVYKANSPEYENVASIKITE